MFLFYLVLLALGIVADLPNTIWFVPLRLSVACAHSLVRRTPATGGGFLGQGPEARQARDDGLLREASRHPIYVFGTMAFLLVLLALQAAGRRWPSGPSLIPVQVNPCPTRGAGPGGGVPAPSTRCYRSSTWF